MEWPLTPEKLLTLKLNGSPLRSKIKQDGGFLDPSFIFSYPREKILKFQNPFGWLHFES